jgi:hypothetical protein
VSKNETTVYFDDVNARARTAPVVPRKIWAGAKPSECHQNCEAFAAQFEGFEIMRGWLVLGGSFCIPHSIVRDKRSQVLFDITPESGDSKLPFVEHLGRQRDFDILRQGRDGGWLHPQPSGLPSDYAAGPVDA